MKPQVVSERNDDILIFNKTLIIEYIEKIQNETITDISRHIQDARTKAGASLLHVAAGCDNEKITKYLIDLGFDINLQDWYGRTALMLALKKEHYAIAKVLLESNADVCICDEFGISALRVALKADSIVNIRPFFSYFPKRMKTYRHIVKMMLDRLNDHFSSDSEKVADQLWQIDCPLYHVVFANDSKVMRIMIEKGSPINATDCFQGNTALHLAVEHWKLDKVKILLDYGADVDALNYSSETPLMRIYSRARDGKIPPDAIELVKILLKHKKTYFVKNIRPSLVDQLHEIFRCGSYDAVRAAITECDDDLFLARNDEQHTKLHVLAKNTKPGIEEMIKGRRIDVIGKSIYGDTALSCALDSGNYNMAEYLLSQGACVNCGRGIERMFGIRVLFTWTIERRVKFMNLILQYGANIEDRPSRYVYTKTLFDLASGIVELDMMEPVLARFAIRQVLGVPISKRTLEQIHSREQFQTYFDSCIKQLQEEKTSVIFNSVSVFGFLTNADNIISLYARDRIFVSHLSKYVDRLNLNRSYMDIFRRRFLKISEMAESRAEAEPVIDENIGNLFEYNSIITRKIVDSLDDEDVQILLGKVHPMSLQLSHHDCA